MAFLWNGASHAARHDFLGVGMNRTETRGDDCYCRNYSALVQMATGIHVTMIVHTIRSIDPAIVRDAIARATAVRKP